MLRLAQHSDKGPIERWSSFHLFTGLANILTDNFQDSCSHFDAYFIELCPPHDVVCTVFPFVYFLSLGLFPHDTLEIFCLFACSHSHLHSKHGNLSRSNALRHRKKKWLLPENSTEPQNRAHYNPFPSKGPTGKLLSRHFSTMMSTFPDPFYFTSLLKSDKIYPPSGLARD